MKNPYDGKNAGRNILITIALIAIGLFLWNTYISPLMAFGDAVNIKNTGSCTFTCFLTNVNNDASFTVKPGQTKTVSLPNIGGIYQGACYDPSKYVNGNPSTYTAINTANSFTYNFNIPQTNCVGTTTTQIVTTTQGGSCKTVSSYDLNDDCIIDSGEANDAWQDYQNGVLSWTCYKPVEQAFATQNEITNCNAIPEVCDANVYDTRKDCYLEPDEGATMPSDYASGKISIDCYHTLQNIYINRIKISNCVPTVAPRKDNDASCIASTECISLNCNNNVCCNSGTCGYNNHCYQFSLPNGKACADGVIKDWVCNVQGYDKNHDDCITDAELNVAVADWEAGRINKACADQVLEMRNSCRDQVTTTTLRKDDGNWWNLTNQQIGLIIITSVLVVLALYYSGAFKKLTKKK
jgi:hypothetical protein